MTMEDGLSEGRIFLANKGNSNYMMILESDGTPYFYRKIPPSPFDFTVQLNGELTIVSTGLLQSYDSNFNLVQEFSPPDSFLIDPHEFKILENGNYFILAVDTHEFDMSPFIEGGKENAVLRDNIILEYNSRNELVFEWNSKDYFHPADALNEQLSQPYIDYVHVNSIDVDYDSNLVISSRNLSEITKINRKTGEIIWRFGGANNQFELEDDAGFFSYQHDVHPVKGKKNHYTVFDNGNFRVQRYSRAVEYKLDPDLMTAVKVWEYKATPVIFSPFMGSVQRLPNGNTLINWGDARFSSALEVDSTGEIVYEAGFGGEHVTYRTQKFNWSGIAERPYLIAEPTNSNVNLIFNRFGDVTVDHYNIYSGKHEDSLSFLTTAEVPYAELNELANNKVYFFAVTSVDSSGIESEISNIEMVETKFTSSGDNMLDNGDFSEGTDSWEFYLSENSDASIFVSENSELVINIKNGGTDFNSVEVSQSNIQLINGTEYNFSFDAYSDESRVIDAKIIAEYPYEINYGKIGLTPVTTSPKHYSYNFTMNDPSDINSKVVFRCGNSSANLYIDNVVLKEIVPTSLNMEITIVSNFKLEQNYPNPFNPATVIEYSLPTVEQNSVSLEGQKSRISIGRESLYKTSLKIYDILGTEITTLVDKPQAPGDYKIKFDAGKLSSGVYFYSLQAGNFHSVKKMLLLK
jgi:hypothetical protein